MSTTCPIARCGLAKRADQLMCRAHWLMVDRDLRAEIWKLYDPTAKRQSHDYWVKVKEAFRLARREDAKARGLLPRSTPTQGGSDGK